jgi:hypothetical protein
MGFVRNSEWQGARNFFGGLKKDMACCGGQARPGRGDCIQYHR